MRSPRHRRGSAAAAITAVGALMLAGVSPAVAAEPIPGAPEIQIADTDASQATNSLYKYLIDQQGQGILFGHQHDTDNGITFTEANGTNSDVFAGTGDYPGMFGWDTLILEGLEKPGTPTNTPEQNVQALADNIINGDRLGGINTLSAHMKNFVTGNDFNDTSGRVVSQILPGAPKNADFNAYLDLIAETAKASVDADGNLIPIIFRPFHENTGSWFWWGAAHATAGEYKEIFRYTVEYLRDAKDVSNLLYAYSPNGSFGGDPSRYLATYPGDQWVDVLGYDSYENSNAPDNSDAWIATVIPDLAMVTDLAEERGKIPAFTEFGRNGDRTIKETGNKSLTYFTDLLNAIKADPKAKRITYMETWSNWELAQFYVPYPAYGNKPAHEMLPDFLDFFDDDYTVFASDVADDALTRPANAVPAEPTVRVVSPADGVRITTPTTTVRVKATTAVPTRVWFTAGDATEHELTLGADGYYSGEWVIGDENLINQSVTVAVTAQYADAPPLTTGSEVILGEVVELPLGVVDDFEGYADDASLRAAYTTNNVASDALSLSAAAVGSGTAGVQFAYDFTSRDYQGFGKVFTTPQDWSGFNQINAWIDPDGSNQKLVLQVNTTNGESFEAYPSLAGTDPTALAIDILDFRAKSDPNRSLATSDLASVKEFWVYINKVGTPAASSIGLDDIRAIAGDAEPTLPPGEPTDPTDPVTPGVVDDFEGYADDAALRAAWSRPGAATLSLSADQKASGEFGAAFPYTPAFDEFQKAVDDDWSAFDQFGMWVKPDGNEQKVVLQLVAGGFYYDAVAVVSGTAPVQVAVPFGEFTPSPFQGRDPALRPSPAELADVQQLVMFIEPTENSAADAGVLYLDDIAASVGETEPPVVVPADSTTSLSIGNQILFTWQKAKATVTVRSAGDETPTGEVTLAVNGKRYTADVDAKGRAKFTLPKLKQGLYLVSAAYAGDENTEASTSRTKLILVLF